MLVLVVLVAAVAVVAVTRGAGETEQSAPAAAWDAPAYTGGARLAVEQSTIDHGEVPYGHTVEAVFRVRNSGDAPLQLGEPTVKTLEGC